MVTLRIATTRLSQWPLLGPANTVPPDPEPMPNPEPGPLPPPPGPPDPVPAPPPVPDPPPPPQLQSETTCGNPDFGHPRARWVKVARMV